MGKLKSFIKFVGTFDELSFYKSADGYLVRSKGGIAKERILRDPQFIRTRENMNEFTSCASSGQFIRRALGPLLYQAKDAKLSSRMLQRLYLIKNCDSINTRGLRTVHQGLQHPIGKALLRGFDFNQQAPLGAVLKQQATLDTETGAVTLPDFIPAAQLSIPEGATHVTFCSVFLRLNLEQQQFERYQSDAETLPLHFQKQTIVLTPKDIPSLPGVSVYLLHVTFKQEVNGISYVLNNGVHNVFHVLEVD